MTIPATDTPSDAGLVANDAPVRSIQGRSPWALAWARLRRDKVAMLSLAVILLIVACVLAAPLFAALTGHGPDTQYRQIGLSPDGLPVAPNGTFWFGTDDLGRDILVRIMYGGRVSLLIGVVATIVSVVIGVVIGLAAGFFGGWVDTILARLIDVVLSVPFILIAVALVAITGPGMVVMIAVIGFFNWAAMARIVRGQVISLREREFVEAARSLGAGNGRIMFVDILPNVMAQVIVYTSMLIPVNIITAATLSFLGLGLPAPAPDWGGMISESLNYYLQAWWFVIFPGMALLVTTVAFNLLGDGIRDALDPRTDRLIG